MAVFPLLWSQIRVHIQQLLRVDEEDFVGQLGLYLREFHIELVLRDLDGLVDSLHRLLQKGKIPVRRVHHLLPVPLVHIDGVQIVQIFIGP